MMEVQVIGTVVMIAIGLNLNVQIATKDGQKINEAIPVEIQTSQRRY